MPKLKCKLPVILLAAAILIGSMSACSTQSGSSEEYDRLLNENKELTSQLASLQETVKTKVTGNFVATVRALSPDYVLDTTTSTVAVLTCFQSSPFMVYVGQEVASQLKVGESYYFEIEPMEIGEISRAEFDEGCPAVEAAFPLFNLRIASFRAPAAEESGLDSTHVIYEESGK